MTTLSRLLPICVLFIFTYGCSSSPKERIACQISEFESSYDFLSQGESAEVFEEYLSPEGKRLLRESNLTEFHSYSLKRGEIIYDIFLFIFEDGVGVSVNDLMHEEFSTIRATRAMNSSHSSRQEEMEIHILVLGPSENLRLHAEEVSAFSTEIWQYFSGDNQSCQ